MKKETGGSAFPLKEAMVSDNEGMTLRDYFAAKAMQASLGGFISAHADNPSLLASIAENAYAMADAMLTARAA